MFDNKSKSDAETFSKQANGKIKVKYKAKTKNKLSEEELKNYNAKIVIEITAARIEIS